jgi:glycyl-tRNA synthetase beta subunit
MVDEVSDMCLTRWRPRMARQGHRLRQTEVPQRRPFCFALSCGVDDQPGDVVKTPKGEYLSVTKTTGRPAMEFMPAILEDMVLRLPFQDMRGPTPA